MFAITGGAGMVVWVFPVEALRWTCFVTVEEAWKTHYLRLSKIQSQGSVGAKSRAHATSGAAMSLGYATAQSMLFLVIVTSIVENNGGSYDQEHHIITGGELGWMVFLTLVFGFVSMPLNIMASYIAGMQLANVQGEDNGSCCPCGFPPGENAGVLAFLRILKWPVIFRSALIVQFFLWLIIFGIILDMWLLAFLFLLVSIVLVYVCAFRFLKRMDSELNFDHDVYRSVYGFQLLQDDDEDVEMRADAVTPGTAGGVMPARNIPQTAPVTLTPVSPTALTTASPAGPEETITPLAQPYTPPTKPTATVAPPTLEMEDEAGV